MNILQFRNSKRYLGEAKKEITNSKLDRDSGPDKLASLLSWIISIRSNVKYNVSSILRPKNMSLCVYHRVLLRLDCFRKSLEKSGTSNGHSVYRESSLLARIRQQI